MKNKNPKDNPWKASFSSTIMPVVSKEKDKFLSKASINKLRKFIPELNVGVNQDLLPIAFNAYVANRVNKNDDVIGSEESILMRDNFVNKPINVEHNRNKIIGCVLKSGFSVFGTDDPYEEDELLDYLMSEGQNSPFNSTLGGIIWRIAGEEISSFIEDSSDPSSNKYKSVSASWEVSFSEFDILILPDGSKNLSDGKIISDDIEIDKMMNDLRGFGGTGYHEGKRIYRLIIGEVLPLGIGLTENPAADVEGVLTEKKGLENHVGDANEDPDSIANAQNIEKTVKINKDKQIMKIKNLTDITDEKLKAGEIAASAVTDFIKSGLEKASEDFSDSKNKLSKDVSEAQELLKTVKAENETIKSELKDTKESFTKIENQLKAKELEDSFNSRMQVIAEKFVLTDSQEKAITGEVKALESDEAFASYLEKISLFVTKKEDIKVEKKVDSKASSDKTVSDAIDNGVKKSEAIASSSSNKPSLHDRFKGAFKVQTKDGSINL